MIDLIITMLLAFTWLLYETDWMRVRLPVGILPEPIKYQTKTWEELKPWNPTLKHYPMWVVYPSNISPLCGWDWLKNTAHIIPQYHIELNFGTGYKQTINLKAPSQSIIKEVMKVNTGKKFLAQFA